MNKRILISQAILGTALLAGCVFDEGGKASTNAQARFDIQAVSAARTQAQLNGAGANLQMADSNGVVFTVTEARLLMEKIKLVASKDDSCEAALKDTGKTDGSDSCDDGKNTLKGPFVVNLLTGTATPQLGTVEVPAGTYHKVKIHLGQAKKSDGIVADTDPLLDHTLFVGGTFVAPGEAARPFTLVLKFDEEEEVENLAGMKLDAATLSTVLVSIRIDQWLSDMDVARCLARAEVKASLAGGVAITEDSELGRCLDIEKTVKENIRASFEVEDDDDHDGKREDDDGKDSI